MFITPNQLNAVRTTLSRLSQENIESSATEIEVRFGTFSSGQNFVNGVSREVFDRIRDFLTQASRQSHINQNVYIHSEDKIFRDLPVTSGQPKMTERYTTVFNAEGMPENRFRTIKARFPNIDVVDYFFRISVAQELTDTPDWPNELIPIYVREKKRWSYILNKSSFQIDLTEVTSYRPDRPREAETVYEVEVEVLPPKFDNLNRLNNIIQALLLIILDTPIIYSNTEKLEVISRINEYLGSRMNIPGKIDFRPLSQVRNIKIRDMVYGGLIPETDHSVRYSVTIKADGLRKLLVIDSDGIYLVYPPVHVMKIFSRETAEKLSSWIGTVIEGELIPKANILGEQGKALLNKDIYFLMFDTLSVSGNTQIRDEPHPVRQEYIRKIETIFGQIERYQIQAKEFHIFTTVKEYYKEINRILDTDWPFKTDGLIFTPSNYRYDTELFKMPIYRRNLREYPDIVKWKPPSKLSIDFEIHHVASADGNYIELYNKGPPIRESGSVRTNLVRFDDFARPPFNSKEDVILTDMIRGLSSGTIVEFEWNEEERDQPGFLPIRIRDDKFEPNRKDVAQDVWEDISRPIDLETIRGSKFSLVFRYHNRIKRNLYQQIARSLPKISSGGTRTLLSVGSGRGGDVNKWVQSGFTHVIAVEPNDENRIELRRRLEDSNLVYHIVSTTGQDVAQIVQQVRSFAPNGAVEAVEYMLSLSFLFDSSESIESVSNLVNSTLMIGGYFAAFTIDGRYVLELFNNSARYEEVNGTKRARFKMIDFEIRPPNPTRSPYPQIYVNIPNSIVQNQLEYLTNIPNLIQLLQGIGLELISEDRADKEKFLTEEELIYTQFFTSLIMQRRTQ